MDQFRWNFQYVHKFIKLLYSNFIQIKKSYLYFLRDFDFPKFFYTSSKIKLFLLTFQKIPIIELRFFKKLSLASKPTCANTFRSRCISKISFFSFIWSAVAEIFHFLHNRENNYILYIHMIDFLVSGCQRITREEEEGCS